MIPQPLPPARLALVDPDESDEFSFSCADSGCASCCVDLDTTDGGRAPRRPPRTAAPSPAGHVWRHGHARP